MFEKRLERPYRVRFDEAGPDGQLRAAGFLRFAQDLAWIHSESAGFGREWYSARGLTWLVRAIELDVLQNVEYGNSVEVSTEVIGFRRVWARRRSEFRPGQGELVGVAITDWVLLNANGRPVRPPQEILDVFGSEAAFGEFTPMRMEPPTVPAEASPREFRPRRSELDPMAHVNNAAYLDYMDEQFLGLDRIRHGLPVPRRYRAEFLFSAEAGAKVVGRGWADGTVWNYELRTDERELFRARLEADSSAWVGG
ncbi:MAG: thioesterase [Chloroflexota bacterium]|nr:thioesterase [Chloroflexota bacterium]